jgi:hypothetical protein
MKALNDYKNGQGYIYSTEVDGTTIADVWENNRTGGNFAQIDALTRAPLGGTRLPFAVIDVKSVAAGNITSIIIDSVNIIAESITGDVASVNLLARNIAAAINTYSPPFSLDHTARAFGSKVYVTPMIEISKADARQLSKIQEINGAEVTVVVDNVDLVIETEKFSGANLGEEAYDNKFGRRYFLNANYDPKFCTGAQAASDEELGNAIEITEYVVKRGMETKIPYEYVSVEESAIQPKRIASITQIDAEASSQTNLEVISTIGFAQNDIIILSGDKITVKNSESISLSGGTDFSSDDFNSFITLQLKGNIWYEVSRSVLPLPTVENLRKHNIPQPVSGVSVTELTAGGGTINITPGVNKGYNVIDGEEVVLTSNWTIQANPMGEYLDGEEVVVDIRQPISLNGNSLTVLGLSVPESVATYGGASVVATYSEDLGMWLSRMFYDLSLIGSVSGFSGKLGWKATTAGNAANKEEQILQFINVQANTLTKNGDRLRVVSYGRIEGGEDNKIVSLKAGEEELISETVTSAGMVKMSSEIIRMSSSQIKHSTELELTFNSGEVKKWMTNDIIAFNSNNILPIRVTGESEAGVAEQITIYSLTVDIIK